MHRLRRLVLRPEAVHDLQAAGMTADEREQLELFAAAEVLELPPCIDAPCQYDLLCVASLKHGLGLCASALGEAQRELPLPDVEWNERNRRWEARALELMPVHQP